MQTPEPRSHGHRGARLWGLSIMTLVWVKIGFSQVLSIKISLEDVSFQQARSCANGVFAHTFFFFSLFSGRWGKIKLKLTTLPRIFIHVVKTSCVSLTQLHNIRNLALAGVSFSSRGSDSAGCPYRRSPLLLQQRKLLAAAVVHGCVRCGQTNRDV